MRESLKQANDLRLRFIGTFVRYGTKTNYKGYQERTILLCNVVDTTGQITTDHLWFNMTKQFDALGELQEGDILSFDARVRPYVKGYVNWREDIDERTID
jgi:hypothetical protein